MFTSREYREQLYDNDPVTRFLSELYYSKTLLFCGTSVDGLERFLEGPKLRGAGSRRHYALVERSPDFEVRQAVMQSRYGIQLIPFSASKSYVELDDFIVDLSARVRRTRNVRAGQPEENRRIDRVTLMNIGPFETLEVGFTQPWTVILGNNGCGKSTVLKAVAMALCGEAAGKQIGAAKSLLRSSARTGSIEVHSGSDVFRTELVREDDQVRIRTHRTTPLEAGHWIVIGFPSLRGASTMNPRGPSGVGATNPTVSDVLPLLNGAVDTRLDNLKQWIVNIQVRSEAGEDAEANGKIRDAFFEIMAQLTPGVSCKFEEIDKHSWEVFVRTPDGKIPFDLISQGTSAVFGWVGICLQRLFEIYGADCDLKASRAVVLVDEIDAHLHPEWQSALVPLLKEFLPNVQVLATTHSPLVVGNLAANEMVRLRRDGARIELLPIDVQVEGWRADQILTGAPFGLTTTRNRETARMLERYTSLAAADKLDGDGRKELEMLADKLKVRMPAPKEKSQAREAAQMVQEAFRQKIDKMPPEDREKLVEEIKVQIEEASTGSWRPQ